MVIIDGFCGCLSNLSLITRSVSRNLDLRDANASKNKVMFTLSPVWRHDEGLTCWLFAGRLSSAPCCPLAHLPAVLDSDCKGDLVFILLNYLSLLNNLVY